MVNIVFADNITAFKQFHPFDRVYETPTEKDDRYGKTALFEVMDWVVRMKCVGKKDGITKWKRVKKMTFE